MRRESRVKRQHPVMARKLETYQGIVRTCPSLRSSPRALGSVLSGGAPGKNLVARVYEHFNAEIDASATVGGAAAASNTKTAQEELLSISKMLEGSLVEVFRAAQRHDEDKKRG